MIVPTSVIGALQTEMPALHHTVDTGPRAMVTKSSNLAAAQSSAPLRGCTQEQRKGRSDFHFWNLVGVVVKRHLIQIYGAITPVHKWENKWLRPLTIQVESFEVGRWSSWLVLIYYKGIFMLFELPSISHVNQNGILIRQLIPYTHAHTNHSCKTNSKRIWRKYYMWWLLQFFVVVLM